ncbi:uncharacterized protein LOC142803280 isoform X1 [Rhipicephalus microplus]|uniref:uncharacterized protein LOC142803280 isoform X1 n=1 Tax=Rhipicephalus microplus TaxID=6941 RepID=UPI003F6C46F1
MDFSDSLWDDRTPLEQLLLMGLCFGLFLLMISATYLAYFSHTYNLPSRRHVFGMEFDVCTKEVCVEHGIMGRLIKRRNGGAKLIPVQETAVHFYQSCTNWRCRSWLQRHRLRTTNHTATKTMSCMYSTVRESYKLFLLTFSNCSEQKICK